MDPRCPASHCVENETLGDRSHSAFAQRAKERCQRFGLPFRVLWSTLKEGFDLKSRDFCRIPTSKRGKRCVCTEDSTVPCSEDHANRLILEEHFKLFVCFIGRRAQSMDFVHAVHNHHHAADFTGQRAPWPRRPTKPLHRATCAGEEIEIGRERLAGKRTTMEFAPPLGNLGKNLVVTLPENRCHVEFVLRAPRRTRGDVAHVCIDHGNRSRRKCDLLRQRTPNRAVHVRRLRCPPIFEVERACGRHLFTNRFESLSQEIRESHLEAR